MNFPRLLLVAGFCAIFTPSYAFESDVHFGLTKWLALKAGYPEQHADLIATGNQRTDSGLQDTVALAMEYACLGRHADTAQIAQSYHFASHAKAPAPAAQRNIVPGSTSSRREVDKVFKAAKQGRADILLLKLGEALHLLQDSWAYQGIPDTPGFGDKGIHCDSSLIWTSPASRGGWNSHKADLTKEWPDDVTAMAAATYKVLTEYPLLAGRKRSPAAWDQIRPQLEGFIKAASKAEKRTWFNVQGILDTSFLEGISLPDGSRWKNEKWNGRRLADMSYSQSRQYTVAPELKEFYNQFFHKWLASDQPESAAGTAVGAAGQRELAARLKLWRLKDHGSAAELAHAPAPLTPKQLQAVERLTRNRNAYVRYADLSNAFFPLLEQGPGVSPLLPFVIHTLPGSQKGNMRAVAVTKLRHLPYDEVAIIAEKIKGQWQAVQLLSLVNH